MQAFSPALYFLNLYATPSGRHDLSRSVTLDNRRQDHRPAADHPSPRQE
jgi:hypothetical protein